MRHLQKQEDTNILAFSITQNAGALLAASYMTGKGKPKIASTVPLNLAAVEALMMALVLALLL